jgi:hypothetical protein
MTTKADGPASEPTVESLLDHLRLSRAASDLLRPKYARRPTWGFMSGKELAMSMWRQADAYGEAVLLLASHSPPLERPITVLARSLYEGSMTLLYCSYNPEVRMDQMRIGCFEDYLKVTRGEWVKKAPESKTIAAVRARFEPQVAAAYAKEDAYRSARKGAKGKKPPNDWDRCATLPSFYERMKSMGFDHMYDPMYGAQSGIAHWSLSGFLTAPDLTEDPPEVTLVHAVETAASEYRNIVKLCAGFVGFPNALVNGVFSKLSAKGSKSK